MSKRPRTVFLVAGARPNFVKIAPLWREFRGRLRQFSPRIVHTGQHYDPEMSLVFFRDLGLPDPHYLLGAGPGTPAGQTAKIMVGFEKVCLREKPGLVVVVGDANSTLACAVTAKKLGVPVAHVEAGLRSRDWSMPEETNRFVTDSLSDHLFTPSREANENLLREGIDPHRIHFVGNVMIDALAAVRKEAAKRAVYRRLGLSDGEYGLATFHRPSNVDTPENLRRVVETLARVNDRLPLLFPIHPRTRKSLEAFGLARPLAKLRSVHLAAPLGYLDFINLEIHARFVLTDSGGVQEETTWLGIPCLTLRENTERPVTVSVGTNKLVAIGTIEDSVDRILDGLWKKGRIPELWDGQSAERIIRTLAA